MPTSRVSDAIRHLHRAPSFYDGAGLTDGQLLEDYVSRGEQAALAALVHRHGLMVWGVCRRALRNHHDAEDAFQATFLVLVRRAASIASRELLANWLYGVARQTALKARATAARREGRERQLAEVPEPARTEQGVWLDWQPVLDEELGRLPDSHRAVVVLCDLEGKTRKEAARQLGVPEGTVAGRLARARTTLAKRLTRRGVALPGGALAAVLLEKGAAAGVPPSVASSTIEAAALLAAGAIPVRVAALAEGVMKAMWLNKLKAAAVVVLVLGLIGTGATVLAGRMAAAPGDSPPTGADRPKAGTKKNQGPSQGGPIPSDDDLRGKWTGEKSGVKVELTFTGNKAKWQVEFQAHRKPKAPEQQPTVSVGIGADLKCARDEKAGRLGLYLPTYLGDDREIKNKYPVLTGRAAVGEIERGAGGTVQLRIIPTGYGNPDQEDYDYPAVEGLVLHRVTEPPK